MILKIKTSADLPSSEITPEKVYRSRREFLTSSVAGLAVAAANPLLMAAAKAGGAKADGQSSLLDTLSPLKARKSAFTVDEAVDKTNTFDQITQWNNYYEFTTAKDGVWKLSDPLRTKPWTVSVEGLVKKPGNYGVEDLINFNQLEERVYRHRCVERWSAVIPWIGVPLSDVLKKVQPQPGAKFVEFTTVQQPEAMPGLKSSVLHWPYVEGLRMDEAMHPLALMVVGLYGKVLPNQNGAPLRIHVPWKYGFKSGKSIVRIRFTDTQPANSWNVQKPNEYGFYANVNPTVDHPRWSQARERRLGEALMNRPTVMFNGYGDQVASLYAGMDLVKNY
jgi:sulfoxide reductase catalytic subunit YedY